MRVDRPGGFGARGLGESAAAGSVSACCARADSQGTPKPSVASPAPFPAWARAANAPESDAEAAFLAGAALARLDAIVRENPPWAGVWRRRLALSAAAASVAPRRADRGRGGACATRSISPGRAPIPGPPDGGSSPGGICPPARRGSWRSSFHAAAEVLGVPHDEALQEAVDAAEAGAAGDRPAPFAAAQRLRPSPDAP